MTPDQVTDEGIADAVMYNMVYRPKFPAFNRRDYLENCIYLIPWTKPWLRRILISLQKRHNPVLAMLVTVIAQIRYKQDFQHSPLVVWPRRIFLGLQMLVHGDFAELRRRVSEVSERSRYAQPNTGRISAR